jgi:hypothetical protein
MPTLIINRTNEYANRWRAIDIYVDGQKTGVIGSGETKEFDILPGAHIVNCKIDWCGSNDVPIDLSGNEVKLLTLSSGFFKNRSLRVVITVSSVLGIISGKIIFIILPMIALIYMIYKLSFGRNSYLVLKEGINNYLSNSG